MELGFSLYLELIRFGAALLVFFGHIIGLSPLISKLLGTWYLDHDGVVIFFVLSGYVIAYVTAEKEKSLYQYTVNRMARIYSVALPALLLALIVEYFFWRMSHSQLGAIKFGSPEISNIHQLGNIFKNFFTSLLFLNEIRWNEIMSFADGPYWSLGYEVWYYILFATFFFSRGLQRWLGCSVVAVIMGIKILLLFPVWLIGVAVHRIHSWFKMDQSIACTIWLATFMAYFIMKFHHPFEHYYQVLTVPLENKLHKGLGMSVAFGWDYILGLLVGTNIFAFRYIKVTWLQKTAVSKVIKFCASYTFSLYLYQMPMLVFWSLIIWQPLVKLHSPNAVNILLLVISIFLSVITLGQFTEHKKHVVRNWIKWGFARLVNLKSRKAIKMADYQEV